MALFDRVKASVTAAPGTGVVSLGAAVPGFRGFTDVPVPDQSVVSYAIEDGTNFEIGHGVYTASGNSLARTTIVASSSSGGAISASANAVVYLTVLSSDLAQAAVALEKPFVAPPKAATWTQQNFQSWTHLVDYAGPGGGVQLYEDFGTNTQYGNINTVRMAMEAIANSHWQVIARLRRQGPSVSFSNHGLCIRDSASGTSMFMGVSDTNHAWGALKMNSDTSYSNDVSFTNTTEVPCDWWSMLAFNGSTTTFSISRDGVFFVPVQQWIETAAKGGFLTNGATHVGFGFSINNSADNIVPSDLTCLSWEYKALA